MGTTAQKLEYLGTTKSQEATMINYGLQDADKITNSTTFRQYVSKIKEAFLEALRTPDTLFTNLPKKSGTGANITLNDTANAPMRITLGATELTQDGTPTPSSPQDIHTISGSNTIKVEGKNLFDESKLELGSIDASTGQNSSSNLEFRTTNYIEVDSSTNYTLSNQNYSTYTHRGIFEYDQNHNYIKRTNDQTISTTTGFTLQTSATTKYVRIRYIVGSTISQIPSNMQLQYEKNSTQTAYTPYTLETKDIDLGDIEYCKIGSYEDVFFKNIETSPYYDENLEVGTWYLKKNIGKVVLDGSNDEQYILANSGSGWYQYNLDNLTCGFSSSDDIRSNKFKNYDRDYIFNNKLTGVTLGATGKIKINFDSSFSMSSVELLRTWLSTNTPLFYYILATPTYTPITGTLAEQLEYVYQKMLSQKGQTNISQINNDLSFNLSVQAIEELE